jgi:hypothetical protein
MGGEIWLTQLPVPPKVWANFWQNDFKLFEIFRQNIQNFCGSIDRIV